MMDIPKNTKFVIDLPTSARLVETNDHVKDGVEGYATLVRTKSGKLYAAFVSKAELSAQYGKRS